MKVLPPVRENIQIYKRFWPKQTFSTHSAQLLLKLFQDSVEIWCSSISSGEEFKFLKQKFFDHTCVVPCRFS